MRGPSSVVDRVLEAFIPVHASCADEQPPAPTTETIEVSLGASPRCVGDEFGHGLARSSIPRHRIWKRCDAILPRLQSSPEFDNLGELVSSELIPI